MTPQEAFEHYANTGEDSFTLVKGEIVLDVEFVSDGGDVYAPGLKKGHRYLLIQNFYDGWEAQPVTATK